MKKNATISSKALMALGIADILPELSEAARKEVIELAVKHTQAQKTGPLDTKVPVWLKDACTTVGQITDHLSLATLNRIREYMSRYAGYETPDLTKVDYFANAWLRDRLYGRLHGDNFADPYNHDLLAEINPQDDNELTERIEKQCRDFYLAGYRDGAADMDSLP